MTLLAATLNIAAWMYTVRVIALRILEGAAREELARRQKDARGYTKPSQALLLASQGPLISDQARRSALCFALLVGFFWPVYWTFRGVEAAFGAVGLKPPTELAEERRQELEALRRLADEHNLTLPDAKEAIR